MKPSVFFRRCHGIGRPRFRYPLRALGILFVGLCLVLCGGCEKKVKKGRANVLLITIDTTRADHLGVYGYPYIKTPVIDRLAKEGILYERAMTTVALTLPSHTSILTGLYPPAHGVRNNIDYKVPAGVVTLPEILKKRGYNTAAVVGAVILDRIFGLDQGFDVYDDSGMKPQDENSILPSERRGSEVTDHALKWLRSGEGREPFFMWAHYYDPHEKYDPPPPFSEEYVASPYDGEIAYADYEVGRLLKGVREHVDRFPLIVVLTADHGESLGEHGELTHGFFVYNSTVHVPLIISCPDRFPSGKRINRPVSTVDITPTILDALDMDVPGWMQGESLLNFGAGAAGDRPVYMETLLPFLNYGWSDLRAISQHGYTYIHSSRPELYNIEEDFDQENDLSGSKPDVMRKMAARLKALEKKISSEQYQRQAREKTPAGTREKLAALGYVALSPEKESTVEKPMEERPVPKDNVEVHKKFMRVTMLLANGKYDEASATADKLLSRYPHNHRFLFLKASSLYHLGEKDKAREILIEVLKINPDFSKALPLLGKIEYESGDFEKAKSLYEKAIEISPRNTELLTEAGKLWVKMGDREGAIGLFKRVLEIKPRSATGYHNLGAAVLLGTENLQPLGPGSDPEKALELFKKALELDPDLDEAREKIEMIESRLELREQE